MSDLLVLPVTDPEVDQSNEDPAHIVCCDPNRARCGEYVDGFDWDDDPISEAEDCEACINRMRLSWSCGAPFCRLRSWWRDRRTS